MVKKNLVLLGMMAVGKTTLGRMVAKYQGLEFIDTDKHIEKKKMMSIRQIFKEKGEKFFRMEEKIEILKLLKKKNCVIALGGGAFMDKAIRQYILKNSISIWLDADINILNKRSMWNHKKRPLLKKGNNFEKFKELYSQRKNIYKLTNHKIICDGLTKKNISEKIATIYGKY